MKIYVVRHGQTDWNFMNKLQGQIDIELNDMGREQARNTAELLKGKKVDLIISSPLKRARETANIINNNYNLSIIEDNRIMERYYGKSEGLTKLERQELKKTNPELEYIWNYNKNIDFNNIEVTKDFCNRIYSFLDEIIEKYKGKDILITTHNGVTVVMGYYFRKISLTELVDTKKVPGLKNCEIAEYEVI